MDNIYYKFTRQGTENFYLKLMYFYTLHWFFLFGTASYSF